jgi:phenylalanyl-tRNA synthetase alpha chain
MKIALAKGSKKLFVKDGELIRKLDSNLKDTVSERLKQVKNNNNNAIIDGLEELLKRGLVRKNEQKSYLVKKGPNYTLQRQRKEGGLTTEMLRDQSWKQAQFKPYNWNSFGKPQQSGKF